MDPNSPTAIFIQWESLVLFFILWIKCHWRRKTWSQQHKWSTKFLIRFTCNWQRWNKHS